MNNSDTTPAKIEDIWVALGLLTRFPLPQRDWDSERPAALAAWAYPLVGLAVGLPACVIAQGFWGMGLPVEMIAAIILLAITMFTGAMHEDGLADAADGLWGANTSERRLEIMKDSHIGAYGVIALIAGFALRWSALAALLSAGFLWIPVLVTAVISRAAMVPIMEMLPNARSTGLSQLTGRPRTAAVVIATGLSAVAALAGLGLSGLWVLLVAGAAMAACGCIAHRKIGGQTGDILGATQQVVEITVLGAICAVLL
ncbi:adenosylcobinamide-GDP ribazoletransferase [uncultured Litoreibacter sp.]|uniref:adenosylcobinamide-GDP ribazoletransferase n=1 Tax=uncultured Litoreibacter sp. TaxID=1392394 RepID=UPI002601A668|nr:adenosylcobinamide-GDP ribazoletransferase [uncultured Litoreibacter sp.]